MCVWVGGMGRVGVNIEWGTLPYPTLPYGVKVEGRGEVCVGGRVGYPTAPYPTLRSSCGL